MYRSLRRWVVKRRFQKLVAEFDRRIEEARAKHQPVKHLQKAKRDYVHAKLGLGRS